MRGRTGGSAHVAAILSFLWPGLGHWYAGRHRAALLFALPVLGIAALIAVQALLGGVEQLAALLLTPSSALTILILVELIAAWRLVSIADSMIGLGTRSPWRRGPTAITFAALAIGVVVIHGALGYVTWKFYDNTSKIFFEQDPDSTPRPTMAPGGTPNPSDDYLATPLATPPTAASRINILLTGVDAAPTRDHSLTDTLLVASIDPTTREVAMISFPRDISNFPLWDGRTYTGKINSLMTWAREHPSEFPDGPLPTVVRELGYLLGAPIHYYAAVDLNGFRRLIDVAGGVTVDNPRAINDPRYRWLDGSQGFFLSAGKHTLDGNTALAYVRSRQGVGDSDFTRARRQQQVLVALRAKLTRPEMLPKLPDILDVAGDTIKTNFPSDRIGEMLELARGVQNDKVRTVVLGPPYAFHPPSETTGGIYTLRLHMDKLAELSIDIFGTASRYAVE